MTEAPAVMRIFDEGLGVHSSTVVKFQTKLLAMIDPFAGAIANLV